MDKADILKQEIFEKVKEYYKLVHEPKLSEEFIPEKSRGKLRGTSV